MLCVVRALVLACWRLGCVIGMLAPSAAIADHVVRVRAETRIELDVRRDGDLEVHGVLRDDTGTPLAGRPVLLAVRPELAGATLSQLESTDAEGRFGREVAVSTGPYVIDAAFAGEADLAASTVRVRVDEQRAHVVLTLALDEGTRLSLDAPEHALTITATSSAGGGGLVVNLSNELGATLARGTTDAQGRLSVVLSSAQLGPPAAGRLVARSDADATHAGAQTELPIVRFRETLLRWTDGAVELRDATLLRGQLSTSVGPLERRAVGIFVDGTHVGTRLTDATGELAVPLDPSIAPEATAITVEARYDADAPWLDSAVTAPRTLRVEARTSALPWLALLCSLVFAGAAWWLRGRPVGNEPVARTQHAAGVHAARATALLATDRVVSGTVVHAVTREGIAGAIVACGGVETRTSIEGRFTVTPTEAAPLLEVSVDGFEPVRHRISCPHRGEWRGFEVAIASRRDLASRVLLGVLSGLIPGDVGAIATDRELLALARSHGSTSPELEALVRAVEDVVYGDRVPSDADLTRVRTLAARVDSATTASL